jgi:molybdopterin-guanine dinucleotide biosynthesis protein A
MAPENLAGFVLAGGKSTRMGMDKAALPLEGRTLLEHALAILSQVAGEVAILGSRELYGGYGVPVIQDIYPGCGPLGGIHAALAHLKQSRPGPEAQFALIIAVDTPFLDPKFLTHLARRALESGAVVTTPEIAGYKQPLCAVYSHEFLPIAEQALNSSTAPVQGQKSSDYKIVPLFPKDRTCLVTEAEMRKFAFAPEMFDNLNTPQDLERARRRVAGAKP